MIVWLSTTIQYNKNCEPVSAEQTQGGATDQFSLLIPPWSPCHCWYQWHDTCSPFGLRWQIHPGLLFLSYHSQECGGDTRRWVRQGPEKGNNLAAGGTGRALPEFLKMTSRCLLMCMFLARDGLHEDDTRTQRPAVGPTPQCYHSCTCWHFDFPDSLLTRVTL